MLFNALEKYDLEQYEYGFLIEDTDETEDYCKVLIPKLTPFMNTAIRQNYTQSYNVNIFVNTLETKPSIDTSINISNFIRIKKFNDAKSRKFKAGDRIICCIMNKDIRDIYLTNFI